MTVLSNSRHLAATMTNYSTLPRAAALQVLAAFNGGRIEMFGERFLTRWGKLAETAVRGSGGGGLGRGDRLSAGARWRRRAVHGWQ